MQSAVCLSHLQKKFADKNLDKYKKMLYNIINLNFRSKNYAIC